jgi:putative ABC transport system permease protein
VFESVFLALIGGLVGCVLALPHQRHHDRAPRTSSRSRRWRSSSTITPQILAEGLVFAALLGLVGGFFPALQAARQKLTRSLRADPGRPRG